MPLDRTCEECGEPFVAKTKRARFCKDVCRVKANRRPTKTGRAKDDADRGRAAEVVELKVAPPPAAPPPDVDGGLAAQVRTSLQAAGALETVAGMAAVVLARQIERGQDSGSAVASMTKQLQTLVGQARAEAAPQQRDAADDVMARAAAKIMGLVGESA